MVQSFAKPVFRQTRIRILLFFRLKPSRDQDKDNDICYSPIGWAVFELLSNIHTDMIPNKIPRAAFPPDPGESPRFNLGV